MSHLSWHSAHMRFHSVVHWLFITMEPRALGAQAKLAKVEGKLCSCKKSLAQLHWVASTMHTIPAAAHFSVLRWGRPITVFFYVFFFLCRWGKNTSTLKANEQGKVLLRASQGTWLFASVGRVSDVIIQQQMCLLEIRSGAHGKTQHFLTETTHLVMGNMTSISRCPAQQKVTNTLSAITYGWILCTLG